MGEAQGDLLDLIHSLQLPVTTTMLYSLKNRNKKNDARSYVAGKQAISEKVNMKT